MKDNYCTYKTEGKFFIGVYCINGQVFECSKKRNERGQAVKDAAEARKGKLLKNEKPKGETKPTHKKPIFWKDVKKVPATTAA